MDKSVLERKALTLFEAMLEVAEQERADWLDAKAAGDNALHKRVTALWRADQATGLKTGAAFEAVEELPIPDRIGSYKITDLIGTGGMGSVYAAERDAGDFAHSVAIKLIRPGILSSRLVDRFNTERQILASLNHPGIARLFDGGTTQSGQPFIVMERVDGIPLSAWISANKPSVSQRLSLFLQICASAGYAHRNLIVHRDLTPANVLVDVSGDAKLIDFGIAMPEGEGDRIAKNADGAAPLSAITLTPGYAAPERLEGASATVLSDVFSAGKMLGDILDTPYSDDIDAIIKKATAANPEARYLSMDQFAQDVSAHLDDRPVSAVTSTPGYKVSKWIKRNRALAALIGALAMTMVVAAATTSWWWREAVVARDDANQRFEQVRGIANSVLFDIYDEVNDVPGATKAKEMLASTGQRYLDALASDDAAPADVRLEAGLGYLRLANVMGGTGGGNLGLREDALRNYENSDKLLSALHENNPEDEEIALALVELRFYRAGSMIHVDQDFERGLEFARSIESIMPKACERQTECKMARAKGFMAEGENLMWSERSDQALDAFDEALKLIEQLPSSFMDQASAVKIHAQLYRYRSRAYYYLKQEPTAVEQAELARELLTSFLGKGGSHLSLERDLAGVEYFRGGTLGEIGKPAEGLKALGTSYAIMKRLVDLDAEDVGSRRLLSIVAGQIAATKAELGDFEGAITDSKNALNMKLALSSEQPDQQGFFRDVAVQTKRLAVIYSDAGRQAEACDAAANAIARFNEYDKRWGLSGFDKSRSLADALRVAETCK